jgi:hypothetical protein
MRAGSSRRGKANEALLRLLSKALRNPASAVWLAWGTGGRTKTMCFQEDLENLVARLERLNSNKGRMNPICAAIEPNLTAGAKRNARGSMGY